LPDSPRRSAGGPVRRGPFTHRGHNLLPPGRDPRLVPARRPGARGTARSTRSGATADPPARVTLRAEPPPDDIGEPRQRAALILPAPARLPQPPSPPPLIQLSRRQRAPWHRPRPLESHAARNRLQLPAATGSPTSATTRNRPRPSRSHWPPPLSESSAANRTFSRRARHPRSPATLAYLITVDIPHAGPAVTTHNFKIKNR